MRLYQRAGVLVRCILPGSRALAVAAALSALLTACSASLGTNAPAVKPTPEPGSEVSSATMPITVPMASIQNLVENGIPRSFGTAPFNLSDCGPNGCGPDSPACRWNAGYGVDRSPVSLTGNGQSFTASTQASYWVRGRVRWPACGPLITAGCGDQNNPGDRRHMALSLGATVRLKDDWDTEVVNVASNVQPTDDCKLGPFGVKDITDKITEAVRNQLNSMGGQLDGQLRTAAQVQSRVTSAWKAAAAPIRLRDDAWLLINPEALEATQPTVAGADLGMRIGVVARPMVKLGPKPQPVAPVLPPRRDPGNINTFVVNLPAELPFDIARDQLRRAMGLDAGGVRLPPTGKYYVRPTDVNVQGYGSQIVVALPVTGKVPGFLFFTKTLKGTVYLTGTPSYDEATGVVSFPDLDYTAESNSALLRLADFFKHDAWRDQLRGQLKLNVKQPIQDARGQLLAALNTTNGPMTLSGTIDDFRLVGLWSDPGNRVVRALGRTQGTLNMSVRP
jgi:hypothetical protein